jgi:hypothetical protein
MNSMRKTEVMQRRRPRVFATVLRGAVPASALILFTTLPLYAYVWYSGAAVGRDGTVFGWGVIDVTSYFIYNKAIVSTTLTSPKGRQASAQSDEQNVARADVSLPFDPNDLGTYFTSSFHSGYCLWCDCWAPESLKTNPYHAPALENATPVPGGPAAGQPQTPRPDPPGTIDGAENPELIPDDAAYRLVLVAIAEREDATEAEKARFRAKIASAGLDEEDAEGLFRILGSFQKQLDGLNAQASQILARNPLPFAGTPDYQQLVELNKKRVPVFREAMSAIPARLSLEGAAKFQAYVQNEKRRMKYLLESPPRRH